MSWVIAGLGNPGGEYEGTRHNTGRSAVMMLGDRLKAEDFKLDGKKLALRTIAEAEGEKITLVLPETFMNKSGNALAPLITSVKKAEKLIVIYDDMDLPLGRLKVSFGRNSGGHRGIESVARALKTKEFVRVRVGVSPHTPGGKLKKPTGEEAVVAFLMKKFSPSEEKEIKASLKRAGEAALAVVKEGKERAMGTYNSL